MFASQGVIVVVGVITPKRALRELAKKVVGESFAEIYIHASFETCASRDPKGLYAKVADGKIKQFTGKDSGFEEPDCPDLLINTEELEPSAAVEKHKHELKETLLHEAGLPSLANDKPREKGHVNHPKSKNSSLHHAKSPK